MRFSPKFITRSRKYELSIPPLFTQIEGTLVDAMFMKNLVVKKNGKFYLVDTDGNTRRRPVTLDPAIKHARLDEHRKLTSASEFMAEVLVQRRNAVLHGRDVVYGRAKLSVQALLILMILVRMVREMEASGS
jgi:hypothetical protein